MGLTVRTISYPRLAASVAMGVAGVLEIEVLYLSLRGRLPVTLPPRLTTAGINLGNGVVSQFVDTFLALEVVFAVVFVALAWYTWDRDPLELEVRGRTLRMDPVLPMEAALLVVGVPGLVSVLLASAAGVLPPSFPAPLLASVLGVLPLLGVGAVEVTFLLAGDNPDYGG